MYREKEGLYFTQKRTSRTEVGRLAESGGVVRGEETVRRSGRLLHNIVFSPVRGSQVCSAFSPLEGRLGNYLYWNRDSWLYGGCLLVEY